MPVRKLTFFVLACVLSYGVVRSQTRPTPPAATLSTAVPALVPYNGVAIGGDGKPLTGEVAVTFLIFKDEEGGEPLFTETQRVALDSSGRYKLQLGATYSSGIPLDLFSTGEARWLEVQIAGQPAQARVLLASVPYALKAADATTLGGLPASAFALAGSRTAIANVAPAGVTPEGVTNVTTTGGVSGYLPEFSGAATVVDSPVFVKGADIGIGTTTPTATLDVNGAALVTGTLGVGGASTFSAPVLLPPLATATTAKGHSSQSLTFASSAYNSSSSSAVEPRFQLQAEAHKNDTATPTGTLNLLSSTTASAPAETGLSFNADGTITFAPGQIFGATSAAGVAFNGTSTSNTGVEGTSTSSTGVAGTSASGDGIYGITNDTSSTDNTAGVYGYSSSKPGVKGHSTNASGVVGVSGTDSANIGLSGDSAGVYGYSGSSITGVKGSSASGTGVQGTSSSGSGVVGTNAKTGIGTAGVLGIAGERNTTGLSGTAGVWGDSSASVGVYGSSDQLAGVSGESANEPGVEGYSIADYGGFFSSNQGVGLFAEGGVETACFDDCDSNGQAGIYAYGGGGEEEDGPGGYFQGGSNSTLGDGIQAVAGFSDQTGYGRAGEFQGEVNVDGTLDADLKNFKIDHPNDPANKYLVHASIESSEILNIYSGNVVTDELGFATVQLPSWFETLNGDLRYQLTVVGRKAQAWISEEVKDGKFQIASDATNTKVSWQITGVRQDAYAKAHPLVVEQTKNTRERGFYRHPELYGQPAEKQIEWGRHPQMMKQIKAEREAQKQRAKSALLNPKGTKLGPPALPQHRMLTPALPTTKPVASLTMPVNQ